MGTPAKENQVSARAGAAPKAEEPAKESMDSIDPEQGCIDDIGAMVDRHGALRCLEAIQTAVRKRAGNRELSADAREEAGVFDELLEELFEEIA